MKNYSVFFGHKRPKNKEQRVVEAYLKKISVPEYEAGTTWYVAPKGPPISVEEALTHLNTPKHAAYLNHLSATKHQDMKIHNNHPSVGFWIDEISRIGSPEPSAYSYLSATGPDTVRKWASRIGKQFEQQSVLIFEHDEEGPHLRHHFLLPDSLDVRHQLIPLLEKNDIQGFTYLPHEHSLAIVDYRDKTDKIKSLVESLKKSSGYDPAHKMDRGRIEFIGHEEYDTHLGKEQSKAPILD